ncbi:MAG: methyltransferase [Candidatus Undinarchaeales archaeon]|jgi:protein-S-isoprenylcysteine O-methyltransferase Ste14|nr:methyltransferase [Candidatus Undinarchaeales archaeon]MDP7492990.1 methyltransferase [Candidatus Undinarchaeales archaeon]
MYVGLILMHIGAPIMFQSMVTLLSSVIWIPIIIYWMKIDEATLEEVYGKEYVDYKNRTMF